MHIRCGGVFSYPSRRTNKNLSCKGISSSAKKTGYKKPLRELFFMQRLTAGGRMYLLLRRFVAGRVRRLHNL